MDKTLSIKSNEGIMVQLGLRFDEARRRARITDAEVIAKSGVSQGTLHSFKKGKGNISMKNFINLLRAIDALDVLDGVLYTEQSYSPLTKPEVLPVRVRHKESSDDYVWGDDQ